MNLRQSVLRFVDHVKKLRYDHHQHLMEAIISKLDNVEKIYKEETEQTVTGNFDIVGTAVTLIIAGINRPGVVSSIKNPFVSEQFDL